MPEKIKGLSELLDSKMNQHSVVHPMSSEEYELCPGWDAPHKGRER